MEKKKKELKKIQRDGYTLTINPRMEDIKGGRVSERKMAIGREILKKAGLLKG
jgi:hypothetical protein